MCTLHSVLALEHIPIEIISYDTDDFYHQLKHKHENLTFEESSVLN